MKSIHRILALAILVFFVAVIPCFALDSDKKPNKAKAAPAKKVVVKAGAKVAKPAAKAAAKPAIGKKPAAKAAVKPAIGKKPAVKAAVKPAIRKKPAVQAPTVRKVPK